MICKNCGYMLGGEPAYCPNCGATQAPPNQAPPGQIPQYQGSQYQGLSQGPQSQGFRYQGSSNQMPPNQGQLYQQSHGALPPPVPLYLQIPPKKNSALLPVLIITIILFILFVGSIVTITVIGIVNAASESQLDRLTDRYGLERYEDFNDAFEDFDYGYSYDEFDIQEDIYQNYDTFIQGRELLYYEQYTEVIMENGMGFYLNNILVTDLGDGTAAVDANIDVASYYVNHFLYEEDFLILPMDKAGNALADACSVEYIMDGSGNAVFAPIILETEEYMNLTISFLVPTNTEIFYVYACNYSVDGFSGPVYYTEMLVDE